MSEHALEAGRSYLAGAFEHLGWAIEIADGGVRDDASVLTLTGDLDPLAGQPHLVSALALLTSQAMSRVADRPQRCVLDLGGTLEDREALLEVLARDVADAVGLNGKVAIIEGLSASERRLVHTALREDARVETQGEGPGDARRLAVGPARNR
ncbi:MAG: hypothetical protein KC613_15145 [Myxococcales bacterium]|nr:hypothetical protein [Myxococcales bacterium]MCB9522738.1 hypothetical protein [Myxococcales bacterium]